MSVEILESIKKILGLSCSEPEAATTYEGKSFKSMNVAASELNPNFPEAWTLAAGFSLRTVGSINFSSISDMVRLNLVYAKQSDDVSFLISSSLARIRF